MTPIALCAHLYRISPRPISAVAAEAGCGRETIQIASQRAAAGGLIRIANDLLYITQTGKSSVLARMASLSPRAKKERQRETLREIARLPRAQREPFASDKEAGTPRGTANLLLMQKALFHIKNFPGCTGADVGREVLSEIENDVSRRQVNKQLQRANSLGLLTRENINVQARSGKVTPAVGNTLTMAGEEYVAEHCQEWKCISKPKWPGRIK